jgi:hypothetical protein
MMSAAPNIVPGFDRDAAAAKPVVGPGPRTVVVTPTMGRGKASVAVAAGGLPLDVSFIYCVWSEYWVRLSYWRFARSSAGCA